MTDQQKLILSIIVLVLAVTSFLIFTIVTRKKEAYRKEILKELDEKTYAYFQSMTLKEKHLFPFFETHGAGLRRSCSKEEEKDIISGVQLKKGYGFYPDRIIYIINNNLHYPMKFETIDHQKYICIDDDIHTIEVLVSFERPSHFLAKYQVRKTGKEEYRIELMEEEDNDDQ